VVPDVLSAPDVPDEPEVLEIPDAPSVAKEAIVVPPVVAPVITTTSSIAPTSTPAGAGLPLPPRDTARKS
jgi:hypothetical protein